MNRFVKVLNDFESVLLGFLLGVSIVLIEKGFILIGILAVACNILLFIAKFGRLFDDDIPNNKLKGGNTE